MALSHSGNDVERLFHRLVEILAREGPGSLDRAIPVAELYQRVIPYRANRSALRFETHQDYEMALLRLLAGELGLVVLDPDGAREALDREARSINPDPGLFRAYPDARLRLSRSAVEAALGSQEPYAPPEAKAASGQGDGCPQCDQPFPDGRVVLFCPSCGANVSVRECASCGTPLELAWKFCITCGRRA